DPRVLFLGSESGLYRSDDGAGNWRRVESPANGSQVWSVLLSPHDPDTILVGTCPSRLLRSGGGATWSEPAADIRQECPRILHARAQARAAAPTDADTFWAGVEIDGLRRSRDGGRTWQRVGTGLSSQDIHGIVIVPRDGRPHRLLASTNNDLNLSDDGGETWQ